MNDATPNSTPQASCPQTPAAPRRLSLGEVIRVFLMAAFIVGGLMALRVTPWGRRLAFDNIELLRRWLAQWGLWSWLVFVVLGSAAMVVGLPRIAMAAAAGALFGVLRGTLLAEVVATASAIPGFYYTYFLGREMVARRLGGRLKKINELLGRHGFVVILLIRICPLGNAMVTNCLAGVSAIRFRSYLSASIVGFLPLNFIFALIGSGMTADFHLRLWTGAGLLVTLSLFLVWYFRHSTLARDVQDVLRGASSSPEKDPPC